MLGWVCERASGLTYAQALSAYVWTPMGAEADAEVTVDRNGTPRAAGGISSTAADLARVGQLVLDGGREVLPEWFVDDLFHGGDPALWAAGEYAASMPGAAYRSCWYELLPEGEVLMAGGIHGQLIWIDRARQVVVAKQSCWPVPVDDAFTDAVHNACSAIAGALSS
jgi:CubicO group peptidase (beta-lactamase class C family)